MIVCGDLNVAASQQDVHQGLDFSRMYSGEEKRLLADMLAALHDSWRSQHPDTCDVFSVWDEYTNARPFNRVLPKLLSGGSGRPVLVHCSSLVVVALSRASCSQAAEAGRSPLCCWQG